MQEASNAPVGAVLNPDVTDPTPINMAAGGGKVALVNTLTGLGCNGGSTPCNATQLSEIVDLVGYDGANFFEGTSAAPTLSNTTAGFRNNSGCTDTDNNGADFFAAVPSPRNLASPIFNCRADVAPSVGATNPANGGSNVDVDSNITITFSEPVTVADGWYSIACGTSDGHTATVGGGELLFGHRWCAELVLV